MSTDYVEEIPLGLCVLLLILPEPNGTAIGMGVAISSLLVALLSDFVADSV
jgi:hypothetical protein